MGRNISKAIGRKQTCRRTKPGGCEWRIDFETKKSCQAAAWCNPGIARFFMMRPANCSTSAGRFCFEKYRESTIFENSFWGCDLGRRKNRQLALNSLAGILTLLNRSEPAGKVQAASRPDYRSATQAASAGRLTEQMQHATRERRVCEGVAGSRQFHRTVGDEEPAVVV